MLRANVPSARVEVIADTGHFPQIDDATQVNELLDKFLGSLGTGPTSLMFLSGVGRRGRDPCEGAAGIDFLPYPA